MLMSWESLTPSASSSCALHFEQLSIGNDRGEEFCSDPTDDSMSATATSRPKADFGAASPRAL